MFLETEDMDETPGTAMVEREAAWVVVRQRKLSQQFSLPNSIPDNDSTHFKSRVFVLQGSFTHIADCSLEDVSEGLRELYVSQE